MEIRLLVHLGREVERQLFYFYIRLHLRTASMGTPLTDRDGDRNPQKIAMGWPEGGGGTTLLDDESYLPEDGELCGCGQCGKGLT